MAVSGGAKLRQAEVRSDNKRRHERRPVAAARGTREGAARRRVELVFGFGGEGAAELLCE